MGEICIGGTSLEIFSSGSKLSFVLSNPFYKREKSFFIIIRISVLCFQSRVQAFVWARLKFTVSCSLDLFKAGVFPYNPVWLKMVKLIPQIE